MLLESRLVEHSKDWKWSSFRSTAGFTKAPPWLEIDFTLGLFAVDMRTAQNQYRKHIKSKIGMNSPFDEVEQGVILGSPQFVGWIWENFKELEEIKEINIANRMISRPSLQDLFKDVSSKRDRDDLMVVARLRAGYSVTDIANYIGLHRTTVSRIVNGDVKCYK
ncbi:MAG: helix-turn-helix transcriptional regulator [bacterium]|nr:helix-turn-helix transcriptional regulator [bacterium]